MSASVSGVNVTPMSKVEADRLIAWHQAHPPVDLSARMERSLAVAKEMVAGKKCIDARLDEKTGKLGEACGKRVDKDAPHSWLCRQHRWVAAGVKVPIPISTDGIEALGEVA